MAVRVGVFKIVLLVTLLGYAVESAVTPRAGASTCYSCEGDLCQRTSSESTVVACKATNDECVAIFNGYTSTKKGCYSDLSSTEKLICDSNDDISCYKCNTTNCNQLARLDHKCAQCSSIDNSTCVDQPTDFESRCKATITDTAYCYTSVQNGETIRGCVHTNQEITQCQANAATCKLCSVSKYNTILPACNAKDPVISTLEVRTCDYCQGEQCQRTSAENRTITCPSGNVACVSLFEGYTPTKKTCYSALTDAEKLICDSNDDISCYKCDAANCNRLARLDHKCSQCSSADDTNCLDKPNEFESRCTAPLTDNAYCYTIHDENETIRGCARTNREIVDCQNNNDKCTLCSVSKYNTILPSCNTVEYEGNSFHRDIPNLFLLALAPLFLILNK